MNRFERFSTSEKLALKQSLVESATARLLEELKIVEESQKNAQSNATHSESKQESDKDMRSTEASYVARGLAKRVESLQTDVASLRRLHFGDCKRVCLGALTTVLSEENDLKHYFVLPAAGGIRLELEHEMIVVLTPASPIGKALLGLEEGEESQIQRGGKETSLEVVSIF